MKIILTSEFHCVSNKLLELWHIQWNKKIAFVQNAVDIRINNWETIHRIESAKERYSNNWFALDIIDLRLLQDKELIKKLQQYDYLHIHGWDNKYLHDICRKSWLYDSIYQLLHEWLVYIGSSAGSIITWPDTTYSIATSTNFKSDLSQEELESMNFRWFQLHPFYLIPHFNKTDRLEMSIERLKYCHKHNLYPYLTFADNQAIIIENGKFEFIS